MSGAGKRMLLGAGLGFVAGVAMTAVLTVVGMRSLMIVRKQSTKGFDETVAELEKQVKANGWSMPGVVDLTASMTKQGVDFKPRVKLIKLCKAEYAAEVLADNRHLATLMPCTLAVYEGDDGGVYVSKMNTGLMGKVFGGTVARVMGGFVSRDEARMLESVVRP